MTLPNLLASKRVYHKLSQRMACVPCAMTRLWEVRIVWLRALEKGPKGTEL